jgi:5-methylcytosine-specific restriction endonuclease McrA
LKQWQEWRAKNLERSQQYHREYRDKNPDKVKLWASRHAPPPPGKAAEYSRAWRERDPERARRRNEKYRKANPDKMAAASAAWLKKYPERNAQRAARYKARKRENTVEQVNYEAIIERDRGICQICGEPVDFSLPPYDPMSRSFDHIIPLAKGGPHSMDNVQLAHLNCNVRKGMR